MASVTAKWAVADSEKVCSYHSEMRTRGCLGPSLRARMEWPKLCQSIMSWVLRMKQIIWAMARVGMEGGFCVGLSMWRYVVSFRHSDSMLCDQ